MAKHAMLSPSGAPAWTRCLAKVHYEAGLPDKAGSDAIEGTAAHELRAMCLEAGNDAAAYVGRLIDVDGEEVEVTTEMAQAVQTSLDVLRNMKGELLVEQRLSIEHITGEEGAEGTSDAVVLDFEARRLIVEDYKHGIGVKVDAEDNEQLLMYGAAAYREFSALGDFDEITLRISQPRANNDSEWTIPISTLIEREETIRDKARQILAGDADTLPATPGDKQCKFCRAKATCPALRNFVLTTVADDFVDASRDITQQIAHAAERTFDNTILGNLLGAVDLIEGFCKAVRAKAESELLSGRPVPGYKLVEGRRGARSWSNKEEAEAMFKSMRLKTEEMYDLSLISPTSAEKLHKTGVIGPRQWPKLQSLITQSEGKPSVALASDKRPALVMAPVEDDFSEVKS